VPRINQLILNLLKLLRWRNLFIVAATQYSAAFLLIESMDLLTLLVDPKMFFLSLSTILIAAGGYVINDYYDVKIDYVNKPERVVVGRFLKRRSIIILHATLNGFGVLGGIWVSWQVGVIDFLAVGLLWLYSNQLKRLPLLGNMAVALLTGMAVFIVYMLFKESVFLFGTYASFAFYISLIREIIKDMEDVEGDKKFGCKTLPIAIGIRRSKIVIYVICAIFIGVVATLLNRDPKFWWIFSGLIMMLGYLTQRLYKADKNIDFANLSKLSKQIMILGLISMIFFK
jgi:4-hydroxybenzoate polyprenyltransferase